MSDVKKGTTSVYCTHLGLVTASDVYSARKTGIVQNGNYTQICVYINGYTKIDEYRNFFISKDGYVLYQLNEPVIELYEPIMLNTNPYTTIINGNTEMLAKIKVHD